MMPNIPDNTSEELDEILSHLGAYNVPHGGGKLHDVDPISIDYVKQAINTLITQREMKAAIKGSISTLKDIVRINGIVRQEPTTDGLIKHINSLQDSLEKLSPKPLEEDK